MGSIRDGSMLVVLVVVAAFCASSSVLVEGLAPGLEVLETPPPVPADSFDTWTAYHAGQYEQTKTDSIPADSDILASSFPSGNVETTAAAAGRVVVVDQSGRGNFRTVQAAVNAVPKGNKVRFTIIIRPGVYREKILVPSTKPYITFQGSGRKTILAWQDTAAKAGGTSKSASVAIESDHFIATDLTFANTAPAPAGGAVGKQAVALRINGDMGAFYRCSFYGAQDTLYDQAGRHYFRDCFIQGSIDFIFGDGLSLYQNCKINSIAKANSGSITAQNRAANNLNTGFSFLSCTIGGSGTIYLGRAWGAYSRVVFIRCYMANMILPVGWMDWGIAARQRTVYYGQYLCTGPGANTRGRVKWSRNLSAAQAAPFATIGFIGGQYWLGR